MTNRHDTLRAAFARAQVKTSAGEAGGEKETTMNSLVIGKPEVPAWREALGRTAERLAPIYRGGQDPSEALRAAADDLALTPAIAENADAVLRELLYDSFEGWVAGLSLMDECDERTYETTAAVAETMYRTITAQGYRLSALRSLLMEALDFAARHRPPF